MWISTLTVLAILLLSNSPFGDCESKSPSPEAKTTDKVMVVDSGLFPVEMDSIGLVFYVTALNKGTVDYTVKPLLDKCCIHMDKEANNFDCESMTLTLGMTTVLKPGEKHNFTLLFSNLYVTDRVGECVIKLEYMKGFNVQHTLKFDTFLPSSPRYCNWVPPNLRAYLFGVTVTDCDSIDEDRIRYCKPVDCVLKYSGHRNYFNPSSRTCEKVPVCSHVNGAGLPGQAYIPYKNKCVDLDSSLSKEDFNHFTAAALKAHGFKEEIFSHHVSDTQVRCIHGVVANGRCLCSEGWRSRYMDATAVPMQQMTQLCDVPTEGYHLHFWGLDWDLRTEVIMMLVGALFTLMVTLSCLNIYEYYLRRGGFHEKEELGKLKKDMANSSGEFAAGDDEINAYELPSDGFMNNQSVKRGSVHGKLIEGYALAIMNHFAADRNGLNLKAGDMVTDLRRTQHEGVLEGTCHGVVGQFPDFCVNIHEAKDY